MMGTSDGFWLFTDAIWKFPFDPAHNPPHKTKFEGKLTSKFTVYFDVNDVELLTFKCRDKHMFGCSSCQEIK